MKILISQHSGFCFGVKRAVNMVEEALKCSNGKRIYSLGELIHNPQVVRRFSEKGLKVVRNLDDINDGMMVISSHGSHPSLIREIRERSLNVVDATCPFVKKSQRIAERLCSEGYYIIIAGEECHPEIKALKGFAGEDAAIINSAEDVRNLEIDIKNKVGLLAQTTHSRKFYKGIAAELLKKGFAEFRVFDTICDDTAHRQVSTMKTASLVEVMIIIGGKRSANTQRLVQMCKEAGTSAHHIETSEEVERDWFENVESVGIASGASTPEWIVDEVVERIKSI